MWYRLDRSLIEGAATSQVMRAVVAADFSNGSSAVLPFEHWTFLNADLTVSLARPPVGDWILLIPKAGSVRTAPVWRLRNLPTSTAILAARCRAR